MPPEAAFLIRNGAGRMSTVMARSVRGALRLFLVRNRPPVGSFVSVKQRGADEPWADFKISR